LAGLSPSIPQWRRAWLPTDVCFENCITKPLAYGGGGHCAMALTSDPKNKKCINSFGSVYCQYSAVYTKMFNFRRITLFCLEKRLSKHRMTIFSSNLGGGMDPLALPWLRLCFDPRLGNFLRTSLYQTMPVVTYRLLDAQQ